MPWAEPHIQRLMDITRPSTTPLRALPTAPVRAATARPARRRGLLPALLLILVVGLVVGAPLAAFGFVQIGGLILPNVSIGGVPMAGRTVEQAAQEIDRIWNQEYRIVAADVSDPSRAWIAVPAEFGLRVDAQATASAAYALGRGQGLAGDLVALLAAFTHATDLRPIVALDPSAARAGLESWAARGAVAPTEGSLAIAATGITAAAGIDGKRLDVQASLDLLASDPAAAMLEFAVVPLVTAPVAPQVGDVSAAAEQAASILAAGLSLPIYDPYTGETSAWAPTREEIAGWLTPEAAQGSFRLDVDLARLRASVEAYSAAWGDERFLETEAGLAAAQDGLDGLPPQVLIVHRRPTEYVVAPGETLTGLGYRLGMPAWVIAAANPQLQGLGVTPGQTITLPPPDVMYPLPVVADKRIVISISEQHLWAYQAGAVVRDEVISTGMARSATLPGVFQVQSHYLNAYGSNWDLWMPHFLGIYEALPDFWNGMHGLPLLSNGVRLWADVLGRPASFGCIILDLEAAEWMYGWADEGVIVEIQR